MGIELSWLNERVLLMRFEGKWTWDDFYVVTKQAEDLTRQKPFVVCVIADLMRSDSPPAHGFVNLRNALSTQPPNSGPTYLIGSSRFIEALLAIFAKVYPALAKFLVPATSYKHALEMIGELETD